MKAVAAAFATTLALAGAQAAYGSRGYALAFNERASIMGHKKGFVDFGDPGMDQLDTAMTVTMWIRAYSRNLKEGQFTFQWANDVDENLINPWLLGAPVINYFFLQYYTLSEPVPDMREWHHYGFTLTPGGKVRVYIDGDIYLDETLPEPGNVVGDRTIVTVGGSLFHSASAVQPQVNELVGFHGEIDELTLWSRALTQAEVQDLMRNALDVSSLPNDAVLAYTFDVEHCDLSAAPDCGTDPELIRNYGSAGSDYDMMRGKLKYAPGEASASYQSINDPAGAPARTLAKPVLHRSGAPLAAAEFLAATPTVLEAVPGATSISIPVAFGDSFTVATVHSLPAGATLTATTSGGSSSDVTVAGTDVTGAIELTLDAMPTDGTAFELELAPGAVIHQVHLLPLRKPDVSEAAMIVESVEDAEVVVDTGRHGPVPSGERATAELVSTPSRGSVYNLGWDSHVREGAALTAGSAISDFGGSVVYVPEANAYGTNVDSFEVRFRSEITGQASDPLRVQLSIFSLDDLPQAQDAVAVVTEDSLDGVRIPLVAQDAEGKVGLAITSLPRHGRLFVEYAFDGQPAAQREVSRPYELYDVGDMVTQQYVYQVTRVSSYWGAGLSTGYHAVNVVGSPQCPKQGFGECPEDDRFAAVDPSPILKHDLVQGLASLLEGVQADADTLLFYRVKAVHEEDETYDLVEEPTYRYDDVGGSRTQTRCRLTSNDYPSGCPALAEGAPLLEAHRVPRSQLQGLLYGVWCPRFRTGNTDAVFESNGPAEMFGQQYSSTHSPIVPFLQLRDSEDEDVGAAAKLRAYTDYIEVEYAEAVFPVSVEVGQPRGGGTIVGVYALHPETEQWVQMYSGAPQAALMSETNGRGQYHVFQEKQCREHFRTKALRLEIDTVAIPDWNYIDYIKLTGAKDVQSAMLMDGVAEVLYVPDENAFGEDRFSFTAFDCGGNELRQSGDHVVTVQIDPRPDDPKVEVLPSDTIYVYSADSYFREEQDRVPFQIVASDPDLEAVSIEWASPPTLGVVRLANASRQDDGSVSVGAVLATGEPGKPLSLAMDFEPARCTERGLLQGDGTYSFAVRDAMTVVVVDSSGRRVEHTVHFEIVCEDYGYDFSIDSAAIGLFAFNIVCAVLCCIWSVTQRKSVIVKAAQLPFLLLIAVGCMLSTSSIYPLTVHDQFGPRAGPEGGNAQADTACRLASSLFGMGWVLTMASLFAKMYRVYKLFGVVIGSKKNKSSKGGGGKLKVRMTTGMILRIIATFCGVELALMVVWAGADPLHFRRDVTLEDAHGNALTSVGYCFSYQSTVFLVATCAYHLLVLIMGAWLCYQTMGVSSAFSEAKYVSVAIIGNLEVLIIAIPVLLIVSDSPSSSVFVQAGVIALNDLGALLCIFAPKMVFQATGHIESGHGADFLGSNERTSRSSTVAPNKTEMLTSVMTNDTS